MNTPHDFSNPSTIRCRYCNVSPQCIELCKDKIDNFPKDGKKSELDFLKTRFEQLQNCNEDWK